MLAGVVATDNWGRGTSGVGHRHLICGTTSNREVMLLKRGSSSDTGAAVLGGGRNLHDLHVDSQLAYVCVCLAEGVGARIRVRRRGVGADDGVSVVLRNRAAARHAEGTTYSERGCASTSCSTTLRVTLALCIAGSVQTVRARAGIVGEFDNAEDADALLTLPRLRVSLVVQR